MVREPVGQERWAGTRPAPLRVAAGERAQEAQRGHGRLRRTHRGELADKDLARRVDALDRVVRGAIQAAVERRLRALRREPRWPVRLVPDRVTLDAPGVAGGRGRDELGDER